MTYKADNKLHRDISMATRRFIHFIQNFQENLLILFVVSIIALRYLYYNVCFYLNIINFVYRIFCQQTLMTKLHYIEVPILMIPYFTIQPYTYKHILCMVKCIIYFIKYIYIDVDVFSLFEVGSKLNENIYF